MHLTPLEKLSDASLHTTAYPPIGNRLSMCLLIYVGALYLIQQTETWQPLYFREIVKVTRKKIFPKEMALI